MTSCPICSGSQTLKIFNDTLIECKSCSHVWADLSLNEDDLRKIYAKNYFKGAEYADYLSDKLILQTNFTKRLKSLNKLTDAPKFESVLELGCAYGFFGELQLKAGNKYIGYDISEDSIRYANDNFGEYFSSKNYLLEEIQKESFSDIFMWDVIEHLVNPEEFIKKVSFETKRNGRIYITTGDISAWLPRKQKAKWRMIHPPTHVHYFTKKSITKLLNKYGYEIERISYPPVSRSIRVIFYSLFILNKKPLQVFQWAYNLIPEKASIKINTFDIMFVVAKKTT
ncbi:MAG: class I SAM-dependent methyltransferase [Bacteroidota bacterium]